MFVAIVIVAAVAVGAVIATGGGHTLHGFGHDMQNTGNKIEQNNR
jgi:predicted small secreted protein